MQFRRGRLQPFGRIAQTQAAQQFTQGVQLGDVAAVHVACVLDALQRLELPLGLGLGHGRECQCGRGAVHGLVEIAQHLVSVGQAEDLAGDLLDALVVGPGVAGQTHVHGACAVAGKQAGG